MRHVSVKRASSAPCLRAFVPSCLLRAFTLVELMVVVTLLALFVGTTVIGLDGITESGRLRSAARQIGAFHSLARIEAISSGEPRRLVFQEKASHCLLQEPVRDGMRWHWSNGRTLRFTTSVRLKNVVLSDRGNVGRSGPWVVRVDSDGTSANYACVLSAGESTAAVVIDGVTGRHRLVPEVSGTSAQADTLFAAGGS